jgi:hypothetical protein
MAALVAAIHRAARSPLMLRRPPARSAAAVSKHAGSGKRRQRATPSVAASSFATRCFAALLRMRRSEFLRMKRR